MDVLIDALQQVVRLKELRRRGWVREQFDHPESVADHLSGSVLLGCILGSQLGVDVGRLVQILAVHDLAESDPEVGDIIPADNVLPEEKERREREAMRKLCKKFPKGDVIVGLWEEFEAGETPEAKAARQLERLDLALQTLEYEQKYQKDLSEFFDFVEKEMHDDLVRDIFFALKKRRPQM
ncbi:phosphohydrolase [Candidatus Peregrinibacteria bacterium CG10_big_fil_rev_8_21_14_0_10_49_16]|nr:MAG: phosphohydrolase [Candidatus Peregrinibacteria bacterium CG22_combo_CG10-13_8_21_14_all_49_11]PIR51956.1 MAG: phosphohydrolase [Candidatus Peregrinibacteria bacterium CG10_big_fil_rev_8_21_14_0_10_49_16]